MEPVYAGGHTQNEDDGCMLFKNIKKEHKHIFVLDGDKTSLFHKENQNMQWENIVTRAQFQGPIDEENIVDLGHEDERKEKY